MTHATTSTTAATPWTLAPKPFAARIGTISLLLAGAWYVGVRPLSESLARDEAELLSMQETLSSQNDSLLSAAQIVDLNDRVISSSRQLVAWTQKASESSGLYDRVRRLAEAHKVKIGRIEPKSGGIVPPLAGDKPPEGVGAPDIQTSGYTVQVTGEFEDVSHFLDSLESGLGASKVISFRLVPVAGSNKRQVEASIDTVHYRIVSRLDERITSAPETK